MVTRGRREAAPALGTPLGQPSPAIKYAAERREPPNAGRSRSGRPAGLKDHLDPRPRPEGLKDQANAKGKAVPRDALPRPPRLLRPVPRDASRGGDPRLSPAGRTPATTSPSPPSPAGHDEGGRPKTPSRGAEGTRRTRREKAVPRDPDRPGDRLTHSRTNPEPRAPTQPPRKKSTCTPRGPSVTRWPSFLGPATG